MSEQELQDAVIHLARLLGYKAAAFRPARTNKGWRTPVQADGKGWPDLTLAHRHTGRLIFAELKTTKGVPSPEQEDWLCVLEAHAEACETCEVHVWTPHDWPHRIAEVLSGRAVREVA